MKKFQILVLSLLFTIIGMAQGIEVTELLKNGVTALSNYEVDKAIRIYTDVLSKNADLQNIWLRPYVKSLICRDRPLS